jgi:hypothetical protein
MVVDLLLVDLEADREGAGIVWRPGELLKDPPSEAGGEGREAGGAIKDLGVASDRALRGLFDEGGPDHGKDMAPVLLTFL